MNIHLIHGIRSAGDVSVEKLIPYLPPGATRYPDYGWIEELETRRLNPLIAGCLLPYVQEGDVLIGHSNGAAIAYELAQRGAPVAGLVLINGALERNIVRPAQVGWIDVYYNPGDDITVAAELGARLGLVDTVWGEMGHAGYYGDDAFIANIDCSANRNMPVVSGHSAFFLPANVAAWGPFLAARIAQHFAA